MCLSNGMRAVRSRAAQPRYPCGGRAGRKVLKAELNGEKCNKVDTDSTPCTPRDGCGVASGVLAHPFNTHHGGPWQPAMAAVIWPLVVVGVAASHVDGGG